MKLITYLMIGIMVVPYILTGVFLLLFFLTIVLTFVLLAVLETFFDFIKLYYTLNYEQTNE